MWKKVNETTVFLNELTQQFQPEIGLILGSGLGNLIQDIDVLHRIDYKEIPHFVSSTVEGHKGKLIFGVLSGKKVMAMQGRIHYYEGYSMQEVTFPIRVMKQMGVNKLVVSNASGGVNPSYKVGDIMIINDHINMFPEHPLRGKNDERFGPRFVNMSAPYRKDWIVTLEEIAYELGISVKEGVYLGLSGPTFETLAEYKMVRSLGADCVGMSTVPEVIVAKHQDMDCLGISVISDMGTESGIELVSHQEVLKAINAAAPIARKLIREWIKKI